MEKESYRPRTVRKKKFIDFRTKMKNKLKYKKNKYKIRMYNRKWRQKNKQVIRRRNKLKRIFKKK